jgi:hypothetical protein
MCYTLAWALPASEPPLQSERLIWPCAHGALRTGRPLRTYDGRQAPREAREVRRREREAGKAREGKTKRKLNKARGASECGQKKWHERCCMNEKERGKGEEKKTRDKRRYAHKREHFA